MWYLNHYNFQRLSDLTDGSCFKNENIIQYSIINAYRGCSQIEYEYKYRIPYTELEA
jgi:hypothetical protein